jgi:hypothetical protein
VPTHGKGGGISETAIWKEGALAGAVGAATVAVWFLVLDLATGRPLFTPVVLGSAVFLGARDAEGVEALAAAVVGYTALHLGAFILLGILAAALARRARRRPPLVLAVVLAFVVFQALFISVMSILAAFVLTTLTWWAIAIGNFLAALAMGFILWRQEPVLRAALEAQPLDRTR